MVAQIDSIQLCADFLQPKFEEISKVLPNVLQQKTSPENYNGLLEFNYPPFSDNTLFDPIFDEFIDVVLIKMLSDNLSSLKDSSDDVEPSSLEQTLNVTAIILDFCFHSRISRKDPSKWKIIYLSLFDQAMNILSWPNEISKFWGYPESRTSWFRSNNISSDENIHASDLVSIKAPLSEHLRHWNEFLKKTNKNSTFNTPLHYTMKFKLEKFLSGLLSVEEESNYNRSGQISLKQDSSNPWNRKIINSRASTSPEIFTDDYLYLLNKLITDPLGFAFGSIDTKRHVEDAIIRMLDALLDAEGIFYKNARYNYRDVTVTNEQINENYYGDYLTFSKEEPMYIKNSSVFQKSKETLWNSIGTFTGENSNFPRPTFLAFSTNNPDSFYDQMMKINNDALRKEFILQIVFVFALIEKLMESSEVRKFYKSTIEKEYGSIVVELERLDDSNIRKTKDFYNFFYKTRISTFYESRDPVFSKILQRTIDSDGNYMLTKLNGFKTFNSFNTEYEVSKLEVDESFKKFGFIKLGSKQIDNVWKIKTGLDSIEQQFDDPKELFENLKENPIEGNDISSEESPDIVKLWQTLRTIRQRYLFQLENYNERHGSKGFFDGSLVDEVKQKRCAQIQHLLAKVRKPHEDELRKAREYTEQKANLKRKIDDDDENDIDHQSKKQQLASGDETISNKQEDGGIKEDGGINEDNLKDETTNDTQPLNEGTIDSVNDTPESNFAEQK